MSRLMLFALLLSGLLTLVAPAVLAQAPGDAGDPAAQTQPPDAPAADAPVAGDRITLPPAYYLAPVGAVVALFFAVFFYKGFMKQTEGDDDMIRIAAAVRSGAYAYLRAQWRVVAIVFVVLIILLVLMGLTGLQHEYTAVGVAIAGFLSGLCGYFGMRTATNASARTTAAARDSLNDGLRVAFRAGAVMGLCVTGFALLDISVWFIVLTQVLGVTSLVVITTITLSFAMGASLQALFARVGGGIYTKAADVGADLVGKVEAGIPEDDARNPATIADNVGDNVGDVAGMGADLYESYYGSILAAMALAAAAGFRLFTDASDQIALVIVPPALAGLGILASVVSIFIVRTKEGATMAQLLKSLHAGVWFSSALIVAGSFGLLYWVLGDVEGVSYIGIWGAIVAGLIAGLVIAWGTEYYTSYEHAPTQRISKQSETGPATVIISGVAEGMISTWIPLITVVVAIMLAFIFAGGNEVFLMGVFGVGIAAVGMLSTLGITLATDAYGPIADNAGGNAEMTHQKPFVRERTDMLDSLGNTTAATGKGFAIGSAALTALALLAAYVITVQASLSGQAAAAQYDQTAAFDAAGENDEIGIQYIGHGLFAIGNVEFAPDGQSARLADSDAGLLISDRSSLINRYLQHPDQLRGEPIEGPAKLTRDSFQTTWNESLHQYDASVTIEGQRMDFAIVPASTAALPRIMAYYDVTITNPKVLCGLFLGVMLVFVFCAMTMNAVGRAANRMMIECRRQFGLMRQGFRAQGMSDEDIADPMKWPYEVEHEGQKYPDYARSVAISTQGALKEMVVPSLLAVIVPIVIGLVLGVSGVMGMLAGALVCGFAVAIFMANAGGAWDNAKKYIEADIDKSLGGKGSDNHKATVVGDTVGDPFKDTSGPSLNILIKLISVVSVVFAGVIVKYAPMIGDIIGL